ncbi:MAG TPA: type I-C CRISPR-associated protein Cas8c/Csd1 [Cerasibacillus sp.]|uniref:type I-C CRISPR-associated protein Cas8c/Csd1 n=1 Tax=Cerasibacillus sp. TaxID=2498711 RepID=UPI002F4267D5
MSWLLNLYKTYELNKDYVGKIEKDYADREFTLIPISHTTQNAHIEVSVTVDGHFHSATVIEDKAEQNTLIPSTEDSSNRAGSKIAPYPLHDKLNYVAGDYAQYGGAKKEPFEHYINQLRDWVNSRYSHSKVKSIYKYLSKGQLIKDLVEEKILFLDESDHLIEKWNKKYEPLHGTKPAIFSAVTGKQESAFVRFNVYSPSEVLEKVWRDEEVYKSFVNYYNDLLEDEDYCFVTGKVLPVTERHANKIRHAGDKAKLISANDKSGFTFRGRFNHANEVASISYDVSQKAHNALKWLIQRQGKVIDNRVFLVWGNEEVDVPSVAEDAFDIFGDVENEEAIISHTNQAFARQVAKAIDGYKANLDYNTDVNILILDSATTGRLAILYYRVMDMEYYLERLKKWHTSCAWLHRYRKVKNKHTVPFFGAPSPKDIAFAAYGPKASEKVVKGLVERMLPCIIDDATIPTDITRSALNRASNPVSMDRWEWEKTLSITCALINREEEQTLALDIENNDRDYLFGRLLAIADVLERSALGTEETRATNALRYMNSFSRHPERTWKTIQTSLQPYQMRLGTRGLYFSKLMDDVASRIEYDDFNNKPLSGKYLLGFYSQRHELYQKKEKINEGEKEK